MQSIVKRDGVVFEAREEELTVKTQKRSRHCGADRNPFTHWSKFQAWILAYASMT